MKIPSLIPIIFSRNNFKFNPEDIEKSGNGIWLKYDEVHYPSGVKFGQRKLIELLGKIIKNTVSVDKRKVNFLLWSDINNNWYFKSNDSLIKEAKSKNILSLLIDPDTQNISNKITEIQDVRNKDTILDMETNIFFSAYRRIDPDYTNKYIDFTDTNFGLEEYIVYYDYRDHFDLTEHVVTDGNIPIDKSKIDIKINTDFKVIEVNPKDYGYIDLHSHNVDYSPWWDYLGKKHDRYNNISWRPQYDLTEFSFPLFHKIQTQIRIPLIEKRLEFNRLRNIKRKWELDRCTVCCMDQPIGSSADTKLFQNLATQTPIIINGVSYDVKSY